jgi:hypothetical protein
MNTKTKITALTILVIGVVACNLGQISPAATEAVQTSPDAAPSATPTEVQPSPAQASDTPQPVTGLDPCSLVTATEAEAILSEPVSAPNAMNGACIYSNARDALYMISAAAAQDQEASGILQGQVMMLGLGGVQFDEAGMNKIKSLAENLDYKGFFTELVTVAEGATTLEARLVEGGGSDVVYWVWISAQNRRQGDFVAVRGQTLVNINLIVADTQAEETMLAASTSLADQIFGRLPSKFTLPIPAQSPTPTMIPLPATAIGKTIIGLWERRTTEITEQLEFKDDGSYSVEARKNTTNEVIVSTSGTFTYDNGTIHYVDRDKKETTENYYLSQGGDLLVINNKTDESWVRIR